MQRIMVHRIPPLRTGELGKGEKFLASGRRQGLCDWPCMCNLLVKSKSRHKPINKTGSS